MAVGLINGDFPSTWFFNVGKPAAIAGLNAWTQRMVDDRQAMGVAEVVSEWRGATTRLVPFLREGATPPPGMPAFTEHVLVTDLTAHQHDINGALGRRDARDPTGVRVGASLYPGGPAMWQPELPGLRIDVGDKQYLCGHGEPLAELRTDRFTLFRALSGRRSAEQIRALDWTGSPEPYLGMFAPYGPRPTALDE